MKDAASRTVTGLVNEFTTDGRNTRRLVLRSTLISLLLTLLLLGTAVESAREYSRDRADALGFLIAHQFAVNVATPLAAHDRVSLTSLTRQLATTPGVARARVQALDDTVLAESGEPQSDSRRYSARITQHGKPFASVSVALPVLSAWDFLRVSLVWMAPLLLLNLTLAALAALYYARQRELYSAAARQAYKPGPYWLDEAHHDEESAPLPLRAEADLFPETAAEATSLSDTPEPQAAILAIHLHDPAQLMLHLNPSLRDELIEESQHVIDAALRIYGGTLQHTLDSEGAMLILYRQTDVGSVLREALCLAQVLRDVTARLNSQRRQRGQIALDLRIGIHIAKGSALDEERHLAQLAADHTSAPGIVLTGYALDNTSDERPFSIEDSHDSTLSYATISTLDDALSALALSQARVIASQIMGEVTAV